MRLISLTMLALLLGCSDDGIPQSQDNGGSNGTGSATDSDPTQSSADSLTTQSSTGSATGMSTADSSGDGTTSPGDGSSGGTAGAPGMVCMSDADCELVNDCCSCTAKHAADDPPFCEMEECFAPVCDAHEIGDIGVVCRFGVCELEDLTCDQSLVVCDAPTPPCEEGFLPLVEDGCWAGNCVPAEACDVVPDCTWCEADETCVEFEGGFLTTFTCEPIPEDCGGTASCACMSDACDVEGFETCADIPGGISCQCIAC